MATISVRRQILDVEVFGDEATGVLLQHRLPAVCADVVSPALEAGLAHVDPGDRRISIDRIEIDVHGVEMDGLERELGLAVRRGLEEYLRDHPPPGTGDVAEAYAGTGEARRGAEPEALDEALILLLRTGRLPWSMRVPPGEQFEGIVLRAWQQTGSGGPSRALCSRLADVFRAPAARRRVVLQFTPQFAVALLRGLSPPVARVGGDVLAVLAADAVSSSARRAFALEVWDAALVAAANGDRPTAADLVSRAAATSALSERDTEELRVVIEEAWPEAASALLKKRPDPSGSPVAAGRTDAGGPGEETEGILVEASGLVLLHPYLPRFFAGVGVADRDELIDAERAVCLLHHLATGERTAPEYRVTLAKALCGIPLDEPVPADVGMTDAEADEATALLEAVITHWGALGNASPDGLREGFLRREGVLSVDAWGDWLLRVETRSIDILLDDLPWTTSIIELPWMRRRLIVEWR